MPLQMTKGFPSATEIPPGITCAITLDRNGRQFKGRRLINLGGSAGCKIVNCFVGNQRVLPPGVEDYADLNGKNEYDGLSLRSMEWTLRLCPAGVDVTVVVRNESTEARRVLFMFEGDDCPDPGEADEDGWIQYERSWREFEDMGLVRAGVEVEIEGFHRTASTGSSGRRCYLIGDVNLNRGVGTPHLVGCSACTGFSNQAIVVRYRVLLVCQ